MKNLFKIEYDCHLKLSKLMAEYYEFGVKKYGFTSADLKFIAIVNRAKNEKDSGTIDFEFQCNKEAFKDMVNEKAIEIFDEDYSLKFQQISTSFFEGFVEECEDITPILTGKLVFNSRLRYENNVMDIQDDFKVDSRRRTRNTHLLN